MVRRVGGRERRQGYGRMGRRWGWGLSKSGDAGSVSKRWGISHARLSAYSNGSIDSEGA